MTIRALLPLLVSGGLLAAAAQTPTPTRAPVSPPLGPDADADAYRPDKLVQLDEVVRAAIRQRATPGAVLWLERNGAPYHRAYGERAVLPTPEALTEDTLFDAASLTKVLATTPAVMKLVERQSVELDAPLQRYLPEFTGAGRDAITIRHLLTHTSGLRPGLPLRPAWNGYEAGIARAVAEVPEVPPDTRFRYSDVNFILLGELVRRVTGKTLDVVAATECFVPLGMMDTGFRPAPSLKSRIAPTTQEEGEFLRGVVHDPTARRMGGVAGHAGLFTTAADVARFARMMLAQGEGHGRRIFRPETIAAMTRVQTPTNLPAARRGLGWDIDSPYAGPRGDHFPVGSFGHTGWTGTSLWIDPFSRAFVILMSNRNHPTEDGNVIPLRRQVGTLAAEAIEGFNFAGVPGALPRATTAASTQETPPGRRLGAEATAGPAGGVRNGIDGLVEQGFKPLRGLKVGLITNHTGSDRDRQPTIDLLRHAPGVELRALFSPEHGLRGELDETVPDGRDARTGLPIHSLYGASRQPSREQLAGLDALVFDIQDIGCRFYTYIATMGLCMEAAARHGLAFVVLDRVNPINATTLEGPVYAGEAHHFVAFHALPLRHAMTVGELARMFNEERGWNARLTVIPVQGWQRSQWMDETGLPWINTSPNMRSLRAATLYPGVGLLESAVSVGRGTDTPFEVVGAPYVDDRRLCAELSRSGLAGIRFMPVRFTPTASVFQGKECGGVGLTVTDREACRAVDIGIELARTLHRLYPGQFAIDRLDPLLRDPATLAAIRADRPLREIKAGWATGLGEFQARRSRYLLYP